MSGEAFPFSLPADEVDRRAGAAVLASPRRAPRGAVAEAPALPRPAAHAPARFAMSRPAPYEPPLETHRARPGLHPVEIGERHPLPVEPHELVMVRDIAEHPGVSAALVCMADACAGKSWSTVADLRAEHGPLEQIRGAHPVAYFSPALGLLSIPVDDVSPSAPLKMSLPGPVGAIAPRYNDPSLWTGAELLGAPHSAPLARSGPTPRSPSVDLAARPRGGVFPALAGATVVITIDGAPAVLEVFSPARNPKLGEHAKALCLACGDRRWDDVDALRADHDHEALRLRGEPHVIALLAEAGNGSPVLLAAEEEVMS